jgi:orotate phosphoribosyltransferase
MLQLLPVGTEVLAGLELGGVPIATAMSLESGLPVVFVRKSAKDYGTCQIIEGQQVAGRKVALVEDVITTGGAVADAVESVRAAGADVIVVVCAIWRGQGEPMVSRLPDLVVAPLLSSADLT